MNALKTLGRSALLAGAAGAVGAANAAAIDVTGVVTEVGLQVAPIAAIGGAVLLVIVAVKAFKWVRAALS